MGGVIGRFSGRNTTGARMPAGISYAMFEAETATNSSVDVPPRPPADDSLVPPEEDPVETLVGDEVAVVSVNEVDGGKATEKEPDGPGSLADISEYRVLASFAVARLSFALAIAVSGSGPERTPLCLGVSMKGSKKNQAAAKATKRRAIRERAILIATKKLAPGLDRRQ